MIPDWIVENLSSEQGGRPRCQTIAGVIDDGIKNGLLPAGYRLPTVRLLAKGLGVSDTTVAAAYRLLFRLGQVRGRVGSGTYVLDRSDDSIVSTSQSAQVSGTLN